MTAGHVGDDFNLTKCVDPVPIGPVKLLQPKGSIEEDPALFLIFLKDLRPGAAKVSRKPVPGHLCAIALKQGIPGAKV
jgi:hypothetical protein